MRRIAIIALLLAGCSSKPAEQPQVQQAAITFDGAEATPASAHIAHGERLTRILGCRGCHTPELQGQQFYELYASNLTREIPKYTDAQLERLIRAGVHPSGATCEACPRKSSSTSATPIWPR